MKTYALRQNAVFLAVVAFSTFSIQPCAYADVFGRVHISVKNVDDDKPIGGAQITLHDLSNIHPDIILTTDSSGTAVSPLLENRSWRVSAAAGKFLPAKQEIKIASDTTSNLALSLEPEETTIKVTGSKTLLKQTDTSSASSRNREFMKAYPAAAQNPQQLTGLLVSNPGFVENSANQVHPRGEHSATSVYIQGFQLGGTSQGRFGPTLNPDALDNIDVMTGSFAPEYAGGAAILNSTIRSGSSKPFANFEIGGGSYETGISSFSLGGQDGTPIGAPDAEGNQSKIFSYFLTGAARSTDNALEAPQPGTQSAHNHGTSQSLLGRFDLTPSSSDQFSLILNTSPAQTQIANRTGLPEKYAPFGQGYGFGGALSAEDAAQKGILSQDQAGQDIYQKDQNDFGVVQWRHEYSNDLSSLVSVGFDRSKLDTLNNNPHVNLDALPEDNSIEYNPEVRRDAKHSQLSASVTKEYSSHTFKFGGQYSDESSNDSYELMPTSQLAANALYAADPRLVPDGTHLFDAEGEPLVDANGNQVYQITPGARARRLDVESDGYYAASYLQDTWKIFDDVTMNYGVRYDTFKQDQSGGGKNVNADGYSPRVNLAYSFYPTWVGRASYNKIFIEPPLSQGSIIGESIKPERLEQYEVSLEKEITPRQKAKVSYYVKDINDQVDTGLLIPSTQLGLFTSVNLDRASVHGLEFSYDLLPDHGFGPSAYASYAYSTAKPSGFDNTGEAVDAYNDHDQRHTVSTGAAYTFSNSASVGTSVYYGSGVESSRISEESSRNSRTRVDLVVSSPPKMLFGTGGLRLTVTNLFDDRSVINYNSAFSGTRFQQGETILVSAFFNF